MILIPSLFYVLLLPASAFVYSWQEDHVTTSAAYAAGFSHHIHAKIGLHIGLHGFNVTMKGDPLHQLGAVCLTTTYTSVLVCQSLPSLLFCSLYLTLVSVAKNPLFSASCHSLTASCLRELSLLAFVSLHLFFSFRLVPSSTSLLLISSVFIVYSPPYLGLSFFSSL